MILPLILNKTESGSGGGGSSVWGAITGSLSSQTDLVNALNQKVDIVTYTYFGGL